MLAFTNIGGFIIDMDGVLWHGDQAQPGLTEFFQVLRDLHMPFVLATNNASITVEQYVIKLANMGVEITPDNILTSGMATALYLSERYAPSETKVYVIGSSGASQPLLDKGFSLASEHETKPVQLVVCGLDKALSWDKLCAAALYIQAGAAFYGTNGDVTLPTERGFLPGNGATLAALTAATGVIPTTIGKPAPIIYQQALAQLGIDPDNVVAIGDRLDTDILGAIKTGIRSVLVLSGISQEADIPGLDYVPTWVMQDIQEITDMLRQSMTGDMYEKVYR